MPKVGIGDGWLSTRAIRRLSADDFTIRAASVLRGYNAPGDGPMDAAVDLAVDAVVREPGWANSTDATQMVRDVRHVREMRIDRSRLGVTPGDQPQTIPAWAIRSAGSRAAWESNVLRAERHPSDNDPMRTVLSATSEEGRRLWDEMWSDGMGTFPWRAPENLPPTASPDLGRDLDRARRENSRELSITNSQAQVEARFRLWEQAQAVYHSTVMASASAAEWERRIQGHVDEGTMSIDEARFLGVGSIFESDEDDQPKPFELQDGVLCGVEYCGWDDSGEAASL